ncbi:nucleotidyltransferase [Candidatus Woesearchaeota archaeon]|nr:nucleotidyltransferase [Candidatus Woesearchaeota archaeon]|tara:strand:+ start:4437 stop:5273 length:837 start_codon:yes stop_codon:yes gene_type:complete
MKERVTLTLDSNLLREIDHKIDGHRIKSRSHAIELTLMQSYGASVPKTALILAGGIGTRLQPITFEVPKPLLTVHDKTLLEHLFDLFKKYGIKNIILSIGYKGEKIKEAIGNGRKFGVNVTYVEESKALGTAGPLKLAKPFLTDTFIVSNADELKELDLMDMYIFHKENKATATIALASVQDPSAYGVAKLQGNRILEFIEKPKKENAPSNLINSGIYILEPEVIDLIPDGFSMLEKDIFPRLAREGRLYGYPFSGQWLNTGTLELYEQAIKEWKDIS